MEPALAVGSSGFYVEICTYPPLIGTHGACTSGWQLVLVQEICTVGTSSSAQSVSALACRLQTLMIFAAPLLPLMPSYMYRDVEFTCQMVGDTVSVFLHSVTCVFYVSHVISWHYRGLISDLIDLRLALPLPYLARLGSTPL